MQGMAGDNFLQTLAADQGAGTGLVFAEIFYKGGREREKGWGGEGGLNHILLLEMSRLTNTGLGSRDLRD